MTWGIQIGGILFTVDVPPAKFAQTATLDEEKIVVNDVVGHLIEETEWSVGRDLAVSLQEIDGLFSEFPDLSHVGLVSAGEVL